MGIAVSLTVLQSHHVRKRIAGICGGWIYTCLLQGPGRYLHFNLSLLHGRCYILRGNQLIVLDALQPPVACARIDKYGIVHVYCGFIFQIFVPVWRIFQII